MNFRFLSLPAFFTILIMVSSCSQESGGSKISGKFPSASGKKILLEEITTAAMLPVDSAFADEDGSFSLKFSIPEPSFMALKMAGHPGFITLAVHPGEKITVISTGEDAINSYSVEGSEDSRLISELHQKQNELMQNIQALGKTYFDSISSPRLPEIKKQLDLVFDSLVKEQREWTLRFIHQNKRSLASLMALYQQIPSNDPLKTESLLDPEIYSKEFLMVDSILNLLYPKSKSVMALHAQILDMNRKTAQENKKQRMTGIGAVPPNFQIPSARKDTLSLYSFRGKYVLLVFWASWDPASRGENLNLKKLYYRYRWRGLEILQISLDRNKNSWMQAIASDSLRWNQGSDLLFWDSPVAKLFYVTKLPTIYLIDPQGRIIAKDISGIELQNKLREIFPPRKLTP